MKESDLVPRMRELFSPRIGDDAAVVDGAVVTTDMLIESVDFTRDVPLPLIARKSIAVNLSDLAAMGAIPHYAVIALGLPPWCDDGLDEMLVAFRDAAAEYGLEIVGGDLSRAAALTISVTAVGRAGKRVLLRSGARPGERVYVSRSLGASATGLALLQSGWTAEGRSPRQVSFHEREFALAAIGRHLEPEPEVALGRALVEIEQVTSCIDVSDGLSTDLHNLCSASGCGAEIDRDRIPIFPDLVTLGPALGIRVRDVVLHGGEEYALLFTSSLREYELSSLLKRPVFAIGRIVRDAGIVLVEDGKASPLERGGYDHFS